MTEDAYPAAQLPDIRTRVIADLSKPLSSNPAYDVYALHASTGLQVPADPDVRDPYRQAELLLRNELRRLREAALYWVSPEMTKLCLAAAAGMPSFRPRAEDLPAPYGLIYFAAPLGGYRPWLQGMTFELGDGATCRHTPPSRGYWVCAASWGPWDQNGTWKAGGTWFTFYTGGGSAEEMTQIHGLTGEEARRLAGQLPPLRIDNECKIPVSEADDPPGIATLDEAVRNADTTAYWMHLVLCAFRLMATARAIRVIEERPARPARRRAERARVARPASAVRLVSITAGSVRQEPAAGGVPGRTYHVRWICSGHWRSQWYPSLSLHRPIWIDPYVKGPADAPLQVSACVNVWRSPDESPR